MVIMGFPNAGMSSHLNALCRLGVNGNSAAGVTTAIQTRVKISADPPVYLFDTPGIFDPHIIHPVQGLKIALSGMSCTLTTRRDKTSIFNFK
jgi:ribosome biogenesis GTPase A